MKIQLALALLLASAVAHAEDSPYSTSTPPAQTDGSMIGVGQSPAAGAESVVVGPEDQQCNLPAESLLDQVLALLASAGCNEATTTGNIDAELQLEPR